MLVSVFLAFSQWDLVSPPKVAGLENWARLLSDRYVGHSLRITVVYSLASVPLRITAGLLLAMLLNTKVRGLEIYRTVYYLPAVTSGVAVAMLWRWIFNPEFGLLNAGLRLFGISGPGWIYDPDWALPALIVMSLWSVGGGMVIYLAGLQGVPTELYEAADVDGATRWHKFVSVTLPMISPVIFFQLIMGIINSLQTFTGPYVMTGGGPRDATLFYMLYLYNNAFQWFRMGYASSLAWLLFAVIMLLTLLVVRSSRFWVYYSGELRK
jgi:multiple sugar transport system permease protein